MLGMLVHEQACGGWLYRPEGLCSCPACVGASTYRISVGLIVPGSVPPYPTNRQIRHVPPYRYLLTQQTDK
jgi:hypothetical protein